MASEDNIQFLKAFSGRMRSERLPVCASFELTRTCNLRCRHCYAVGSALERPELDTSAWKRIADEAAASETLFLLLTGGEPLLRPDFPDLYLHMKRCGFLITVFTNGTTVDERVADLFGEFPPFAVEVSLYGASDRTAAAVTGNAAATRLALDGVRRLLDRDVKMRLKSVVTRRNAGETRRLQELADEFGLPFRFDAALFPRLDGDLRPLKFRARVEDVVAMEFAREEKVDQWHRFCERCGDVPFSDRLYQCGAGRNNAHVDAQGFLQPCILACHIRRDLRVMGFAEGWRSIREDVDQRKLAAADACRGCSLKLFCGYCPAFFRLETGSERVPPEFLCRLGGNRATMVRRTGRSDHAVRATDSACLRESDDLGR